MNHLFRMPRTERPGAGTALPLLSWRSQGPEPAHGLDSESMTCGSYCRGPRPEFTAVFDAVFPRGHPQTEKPPKLLGQTAFAERWVGTYAGSAATVL